MRRLVPLVLVSALGVSAAADGDRAIRRGSARQEAALATKSFGEGGGYKHPDAAVGGFLESTPPPAAPPEARDHAISVGKAAPPYGSVSRKSVGERPRPRPFSPVVNQDAAASEDARRDYEERLLGAAAETPRPGLTGRLPTNFGSGASSPYGSVGVASEGSLFVTLELDPREAGSLRDAVAGLGAAAAFRPDARFEPLPGSGGSMRVSGWLPVSRLGSAIARPGVKRIDLAALGGRAPDSGLVGDFLVGLRVADAAHPAESVAAGVVDLAQTAGFLAGDAYKVWGAFDVGDVAGVGRVAVVAGSLPLNRLSRAMGRPGVVTVNAIEPYGEEAPATAVPMSAARTAGFLRFVMARGVWLALLTLLLLLPAFGTALKNGLAVFVPYR